MQETITTGSSSNGIIYTTHSKVPYAQAYSVETKSLPGRSAEIPFSFKLSDKFITMVSGPQQMTKFLSEEQSTGLHLGHDEFNIYHAYQNERIYSQVRNFNDSDHFVAVYSKEDLNYIGEAELSGGCFRLYKRWGYGCVKR